MFQKSPRKSKIPLRPDQYNLLLAKAMETGQKAVGFIGVEFQMPTEIPAGFVRQQRFGVIEAFEKACQKTLDYSLIYYPFRYWMVGNCSTPFMNCVLGVRYRRRCNPWVFG